MRFTVSIDAALIEKADEVFTHSRLWGERKRNRSLMMREALAVYVLGEGRPAQSERGRTETLRSLRAARAALDVLALGLTQAEPVKRRVRRYSPRVQSQCGT